MDAINKCINMSQTACHSSHNSYKGSHPHRYTHTNLKMFLMKIKTLSGSMWKVQHKIKTQPLTKLMSKCLKSFKNDLYSLIWVFLMPQSNRNNAAAKFEIKT